MTALALIASCGPQTIETGNVGVVKSFGKVKDEVKDPSLRWLWIGDMHEISLNDLKPKINKYERGRIICRN